MLKTEMIRLGYNSGKTSPEVEHSFSHCIARGCMLKSQLSICCRENTIHYWLQLPSFD
jgi:hypothetical protein